jgi:hypothetical protein
VLSGRLCDQSKVARNTILSFNYDLLLEDGLEALKVPYTYGFGDRVSIEAGAACTREPEALSVLKLHGSTNWGVFSDGELRICRNYDQVRESNAVPLLLPPTWRKTFAGDLNGVWTRALIALREATRIIIVGFSLPPTDVHFKYLLAAGLRDNISLRKIIFANPDEQGMRRRAGFLLRSELERTGIVEFCPCTSDSFFGPKTIATFDRPIAKEVIWGH